MTKQDWLFTILFLLLTGTACTGSPALAPTSMPVPTTDSYYMARGGGEPRGTRYWLLWNSCALDNRADTAKANGGREAGWIIMDDLLAEPGILLGQHLVESCEEGVRLLQGASKATDGAADPLAAQLLATQLNLIAGAEHCPAVDEAVQAAQLLLLAAGFDGTEMVLGPDAAVEERAMGQELERKLARYNTGTLCR